MDIAYKFEKGRLSVSLAGEIDHHGARRARADIDALIASHNPAELCLDLSKVEFMDSSGLGLVLGRYKKQTDLGGSMRIINPTRRVARILSLAGVDKIIKVEKAI